MNKSIKYKSSVLEKIVDSQTLTFWISTTLPLWYIAWFSGSTFIGDIASIWAIAVLTFWFWKRIGQSLEMIRFLRVGALVLVILQNVAWLVSSLLHQFSIQKSIELTLKQSLGGGLTFESYSLAIIYITLFSLLLSYFGSQKRLLQSEEKVLNILYVLKNSPLKKIHFILTVLVAIEIFLIASGIIGQRSVIVEGLSEGERPFWLVLFEMFLPVQILLNALLFARIFFFQTKGSSKISIIILAVSTLLMLFLYFNKGRSSLVFSLLAFFYWFILFTGKRPNFWRVIIIMSVVYPLLSQVLLFGNFIRSSSAGLSNWKGSAIEIIPEAWSRFQSSGKLIEEEKGRTTKNLSSRPLIAIPLALCLQLSPDRKSYTLGEHLINSAVWTIPGSIFANKKNFPIQEALLYPHFPIGDADTADSIYLFAYTEFSWLGIVIYPLLLYFLWYLVIDLIYRSRSSMIISSIILAMFFQLFLLNIGESALTLWLVVLRSSIFLFIINRIWFITSSKNKVQIAHG